MHKNALFSPTLLLALLLSFAFACKKDDTTTPSEVKYFPKVKAIIAQSCISCHSAVDPFNWPGRPTAFDKDEDIATSYTSIKRAVVDPASPTNKRMPENGSLTQQQIDDIVKWYEKGGKVTD